MAELERRHIANPSEAQAMADFLWNEKRRHLDDINQLNLDLNILELEWNVTPRRVPLYMLCSRAPNAQARIESLGMLPDLHSDTTEVIPELPHANTGWDSLSKLEEEIAREEESS